MPMRSTSTTLRHDTSRPSCVQLCRAVVRRPRPPPSRTLDSSIACVTHQQLKKMSHHQACSQTSTSAYSGHVPSSSLVSSHQPCADTSPSDRWGLSAPVLKVHPAKACASSPLPDIPVSSVASKPASSSELGAVVKKPAFSSCSGYLTWSLFRRVGDVRPGNTCQQGHTEYRGQYHFACLYRHAADCGHVIYLATQIG